MTSEGTTFVKWRARHHPLLVGCSPVPNVRLRRSRDCPHVARRRVFQSFEDIICCLLGASALRASHLGVLVDWTSEPEGGQANLRFAS